MDYLRQPAEYLLGENTPILEVREPFSAAVEVV